MNDIFSIRFVSSDRGFLKALQPLISSIQYTLERNWSTREYTLSLVGRSIISTLPKIHRQPQRNSPVYDQSPDYTSSCRLASREHDLSKSQKNLTFRKISRRPNYCPAFSRQCKRFGSKFADWHISTNHSYTKNISQLSSYMYHPVINVPQ